MPPWLEAKPAGRRIGQAVGGIQAGDSVVKTANLTLRNIAVQLVCAGEMRGQHDFFSHRTHFLEPVKHSGGLQRRKPEPVHAVSIFSQQVAGAGR